MSDLSSFNINVRSTPMHLSIDISHGTARPATSLQLPQPPKPPHDNVEVQPLVSQERYASIIFDVGNRIPNAKLEDVKFLCFDKVSDQLVLQDAQSAADIFKDMSVYGTLDRTKLGLIAELLHRIGMVKAKREVFSGTVIIWPTEDGKTYFDSFRCLLHDVIQQLPTKKLIDLKIYCSLREILLEQDVGDFFYFFTSLEDQEAIASDNIGLLKDFSESILKNQKVQDYIEKYEKKTRELGPVLAMTESESHKLLTLAALLTKSSVSLEGFYGSYDNIPTSNEEDTVEKMDIDQAESSNSVLKANKRRLITPSMLLRPSLPEPAKQKNKKLGGTKEHDRSSPEPMDESQAAGKLQSRDILPDNASTNEEDSTEDWYTSQHDYQMSLVTNKMPCYRMNANPKGICFILSNEHFDRRPGETNPTDRKGSEKDVKNLNKIFSDLEFVVQIKKDLTAEEITKEMKKLQKHDHSCYDAFICCVLSHGNNGKVLAKDGREVDLSKIIGYFKGKNCRTLIGKPKIFIIQACQGDRWQTVTSETAPQSPTGEGVGMGTGIKTLPQEIDILLLLSTVPGYRSARSPEKGSWFIMALTHILTRFPDAEMQSIMTLLNKQLATATHVKEEGRTIAQTALPSHTLTKLLFLKRPNHIQQNRP